MPVYIVHTVTYTLSWAAYKDESLQKPIESRHLEFSLYNCINLKRKKNVKPLPYRQSEYTKRVYQCPPLYYRSQWHSWILIKEPMPVL